MALRLNGSSSGYVELEVPGDAGSHTLTLPDSGGSSGQYLQTNGSGTLSWQTITDTGVVWGEQTGTSTSGTAFNFSSIPADARETIVTWKNVSANDFGRLRFRIGTSGALATSGYTTLSSYHGSGQGATNHSTICEFHAGNGHTLDWNGFVRVTRISGNRYEIFGVSSSPSYNYMMVCNSSNDIGGDLGQIEFFWENSVSFDGGDWGIRYLT